MALKDTALVSSEFTYSYFINWRDDKLILGYVREKDYPPAAQSPTPLSAFSAPRQGFFFPYQLVTNSESNY